MAMSVEVRIHSPDKDEFTDDSENIALLKPSQEISDAAQQVSNVRSLHEQKPHDKAQRMPSGKKFILTATDDTSHSRGFRKPLVFVLLCITSTILALSWMLTEDEYIGSILALIFIIIVTFVFFYTCTSLIIRLSTGHKKETWNTFIMIINLDKGCFYIIDQSNHENWLISAIATLDQLNMTIKSSQTKRDEAFVMIDKTQFNLKPVGYEEARTFIVSIDEYLREIWRNQYIEEQYNKGDALAVVDGNEEEYDMQALDVNLKGFIQNLVEDENVVKHLDGQRLNRWYEREHVKDELLHEYRALVKERDAERQRFEKYMNFEPKFDEDYIAKMLLVKCSVLEILSD